MQYLQNRKLACTRDGYAGNPYQDGAFISEFPREQPDFVDILKWKLKSNPQKAAKAEDGFRVPVVAHQQLPKLQEGELMWLGHAAFLFRFGGSLFITDPCLSDLPLLKRLHDLPCPIEKLVGIDYLLLSHGHRDHLDADSIRQICAANPNLKGLLPLKMQALTKKYGLQHAQEAGWWQVFDTSPSAMQITFLPALHWHRRGLFDFNKVLWGSFMLSFEGKKLYFAGDTGFAGHFAQIRETCGEVDTCLMPIGANKPRKIMKDSHVNPEEAVEASNILGAKKLIPMHYGTYDLADEPLGEPIRKLRKLKQNGTLNAELIVPDAGEVISFAG